MAAMEGVREEEMAVAAAELSAEVALAEVESVVAAK